MLTHHAGQIKWLDHGVKGTLTGKGTSIQATLGSNAQNVELSALRYHVEFQGLICYISAIAKGPMIPEHYNFIFKISRTQHNVFNKYVSPAMHRQIFFLL